MQEKSRFYPKGLASISFGKNVFILPARLAGSFAKNAHRAFSLRSALSQAKKFRHFCDFRQTLIKGKFQQLILECYFC